MKHLFLILAAALCIISCGKDPQTNTFTYSSWELTLKEQINYVNGVLVSTDTLIQNPNSTIKNVEIVGYQYVINYTDGTKLAQNFYIKNDTIKFLEDASLIFFTLNNRAVIKKETENDFIFTYDPLMGLTHPSSYQVIRYTFKKRNEPYKSQSGCATCWQTLSNNEQFINGFANSGFDFVSDTRLGIVCSTQLTTYKNTPISDKLVGKVTYRTTTFCRE